MRSPFGWNGVRSIVFRWDAEDIHHFFVEILSNLSRLRCGRLILRVVSGAWLARTYQPVEILGIRFRNPIGLAAGFDKEGTLIEALPHLGFGYVEVGTVTPRPQPGNPRPRLFRDPDRLSLFNRMGFNSPGAESVARNVSRARERGTIPENFRIGINLGKNKETALEMAPADYALAVRPFENLADYLVVNVSSPNTPGLRDLQTVDSLEKILAAVRKEVSTWKKVPPIFLKLAPELSGTPMEDLIRSETRIGMDGWILSNTLAGNWKDGTGGWSGGALRTLARQHLEEVRSRSRLPILSVGGILDADEMNVRFNLGANAVQVYTGWIYFGPRWILNLLRSYREK